MRNRSVLRTLGLVALLVCPLAAAHERRAPAATRLVEIRSYNLKPGTRDRFHQRFVRESLPMLRRWNVEVVGYGPSLHDHDSWFLMRGFASVEARQTSEDAFYGSDEWKKGPREATLADIESYTTVVVRLDDAGIAGLRALSTPAEPR
jgi:hypothetical protein